MQLQIHLVSTILNASVVVKSCVAAVISFYLLGLIPGIYSYLCIAPGYLLPPYFRLWTLATGVVTESSIINVLVDIPVLVICGSHLEPLWGALELLKYMALTGIGTAFSTSLISLALYAITGNHMLWFVQFSGMAGVLGGVAVAFKQVTPDQQINVRLKVFRGQDLPLIAVLTSVFLSVVRLLAYTQAIMVLSGIFVAWIYLRFYQPRGKGMRGDMSEMFEFSTFFPRSLRPLVGMLSGMIFGILVRLRLCKTPVRTYDVGAPSSITISLPGSDPVDAERRRKKALRALNERLKRLQNNSKLEKSSEEDWPTMEDELDKVNESVAIKLEEAACNDDVSILVEPLKPT